MSEKFKTICFDINRELIRKLKDGTAHTDELEPEELKASKAIYTDNPTDLKEANFHIVAVPTPVDDAKQPDLTPVIRATETVGKILKKGDIVMYESTVYPGVTEEECVPVLEKHSGLKGGVDFKVGFSPERINPGDKERTFRTIKKIVSAQDEASLKIAALVYGSVVTAGLHLTTSIKVAEAAKVIENTQRDLNIALMNELAIIFNQMGIDTQDVLEAAGTKWNFLKFSPGLVGGHCIGVDPYYLTHKAEKIGYIPQVILAGRRINDSMGKYVATQTIKKMTQAGLPISGSRVTVLGLTFKENCADLRNSKVADIIKELEEFGVTVQVHDPVADAKDALHEYGVQLKPWNDLAPAHAVIVAVAHKDYKALKPSQLKALFETKGGAKPVLIDVKSLYNRSEIQSAGMALWRL